MKEREFTYKDGIIEGRLIENGFFAIGKDMFVSRTKDAIYIITHPSGKESTFEFLQLNSDKPEKEMEYSDFVEWARNDDYTHHCIDVKGDIHDIIEVAKIAKSYYK